MVGFSLKKKEQKTSGFSGFALKKGNAPARPPSSKKTAFGTTIEDDDDTKEVKIDTFDKDEGAYDQTTGPEKTKGPLVISNAGNNDWKQIARDRFNPQQTIVKEDDGKKLEYGINYSTNESSKDQRKPASLLLKKRESDYFKEDVSKRPAVATLEEYEEVPVEEFGAAMLRGMGWKDEDDDDKKSDSVKKESEKAQRSQFLGLGAKNIGGDPRPVERYYNPVRKIDKTTGRVVNESESGSRDRSPQRENNNYRSRN
jgi:predicted enzyme related to lactoylglutathione lyase